MQPWNLRFPSPLHFFRQLCRASAPSGASAASSSRHSRPAVRRRIVVCFGQSENDWGTLNLKPIFFIKDTKLSETWAMRLATGFEWFLDFDNQEKGIGTGSDAIGPLLGTALMNLKSKTVLIPLLQHNESYENSALSQTIFRLIALQPLPDGYWLKLDAKVPYDWNNYSWPVNSEFEAGKMLTQSMGVYIKGLAGFGGDRPFDYGTVAALRFNL